MTVSVTIKPADGRAPSFARGLPVILTWDDKTIAQLTIGSVKARLAQKFPKVSYACLGDCAFPQSNHVLNSHQFYPSRQKITHASSKKPLSDESTVAEALFEQGVGGAAAATEDPEATFFVKDLGPQISWRTVFITEYVRYHTCL